MDNRDSAGSWPRVIASVGQLSVDGHHVGNPNITEGRPFVTEDSQQTEGDRGRRRSTGSDNLELGVFVSIIDIQMYMDNKLK